MEQSPLQMNMWKEGLFLCKINWTQGFFCSCNDPYVNEMYHKPAERGRKRQNNTPDTKILKLCEAEKQKQRLSLLFISSYCLSSTGNATKSEHYACAITSNRPLHTPFKWKIRGMNASVCHYPGGTAPLAVLMEMRCVPGRFRLFCPLMVRAWWPWADERVGITGEQGKLAEDSGNSTCSALACPPPILMLLLLGPEEVDVGDQREVPAKVLLCRTAVRVPVAPVFPVVPP